MSSSATKCIEINVNKIQPIWSMPDYFLFEKHLPGALFLRLAMQIEECMILLHKILALSRMLWYSHPLLFPVSPFSKKWLETSNMASCWVVRWMMIMGQGEDGQDSSTCWAVGWAVSMRQQCQQHHIYFSPAVETHSCIRVASFELVTLLMISWDTVF